MTTMENKFTPSANISRDIHKNIDYIHTPNTERVLEQLDNGFSSGTHSFTIIGSYGTGKSSFLLAFEKQMKGEKRFFEYIPTSLTGNTSYTFINIIGSYRSLPSVFMEEFKIKSEENIFQELESLYKYLHKKNSRLVILIDEFGKFLEYAANTNPDKELYFIQQLAEFVNDTEKEILLITTLHQNFQAYTTNLSQKQRTEWEKIKGRFKEITFNEPVEQLLLLAAKYLDNNPGMEMPNGHHELIDIILNSNIFQIKNRSTWVSDYSLLPLDILAAAVLTHSLQKYGQNERSLFSFLKSSDMGGLKDFKHGTNPYFNLDCVYNYLIRNFYSFLSTRYNPDYIQWAAIRNSLERAESIFDIDYDDAKKIITSIGLLNIFASQAGKIDPIFLENYSIMSLGISNPRNIIDILENKKIIRYREFKHWYILFEGTDIDIDNALKEAEQHIELQTDIVPYLKENFSFPFIIAKYAYFDTGTPRFFEIVFSGAPIHDTPIGDTDGFINIIFSEFIHPENLEKTSKNNKNAILYGLYLNPQEIRNIILDIKKINHVLAQYPDDPIIRKELNLFLSHSIEELTNKILNSFYTSNENIKWFFNGKEQIINTRKEFNRFLSTIVNTIYPATPHLKNELMNRNSLSAAINTAKRNFFSQLTHYWHHENLGYEPDNYPPEKTIYLALLKSTGIHTKDEDGNFFLTHPTHPTFKELWKVCENFLEKSKKNKKSLNDLIDIVSKKPFKLTQGFIEFWIPTFLFINRDSFALYIQDIYTPEISDDILFLIMKEPDKYFIKAFNIEGVRLELFNKYRLLLKKSKENNLSNPGFVDTIRPYLTFYDKLPLYTKKTTKLQQSSLALRNAISQAKDPEKLFFEDFPNAFGFDLNSLTQSEEMLEEFINKLKTSLQEIQTCFDDLLDRVETFLKKQFQAQNTVYPEYRQNILNRYKTLKQDLITSYQVSFFSRLIAEMDDSRSWVISLIQGIMDKQASILSDFEEEIIYRKLNHLLFELDNLCEFSGLVLDRNKEEAAKIEITTTSQGIISKVCRISKEKEEVQNTLVANIKKILSTDKSLNLAALINIIKEQFESEQKS